MSRVKPRVKLPKSAELGEIVSIKTLISHRMESGHRRDSDTGELIPRKIIKTFTCSFEGETVFSADWHPSVSSNPYLSFSYKVVGPGIFLFEWLDDDGTVYNTERALKVG